MDKETADKMRGMVRRAVIKNVRDDGQMQTASVEVAEGVWRDKVEVAHQYGVASSAPEDGALAVVLSIGGDEGDLVILPIGNPSKRLGKLNPGDAGIYNEHGDKMVVTAAGAIEVMTGGSMRVRVGGATLVVKPGEITASVGDVSMVLSGAGLDINGGQISHNGKNIGDTHIHPESIGSVTGGPQ